jgi:ATP-dependent Clp protease protease subunit
MNGVTGMASDAYSMNDRQLTMFITNFTGNAYALRTNLSRQVLWNMMSRAEYMNAYRAVELKFADGIITDAKHVVFDAAPQSFSMKALIGGGFESVRKEPIHTPKQDAQPEPPPDPPKPTGIPLESLTERLHSLSH